MMRRIRSNLRSVKQEEKFLFGFYLVKAGLVLLACLALFSFLDVIFQFSPVLRLILTLALFSAVLAYAFFHIWNLPRKVQTNLAALFHRFKPKFTYSPRVLHDIETGRAFSGSSELLSEWQGQVGAQDISLFDSLGLKAMVLFHTARRTWFLAGSALMLVLVVLLLGLSPFRIMSFQSQPLLAANDYTLSPRSGTYFYGQPLSLQFILKNSGYKFLAFEIDKGGGFKPAGLSEMTVEKIKDGVLYSMRIDSLVEKFNFRVAVAKRIEKFYTADRQIEVRYPAHFKDVSFTIRPPAYTGVGSYTTRENLLRVYYGSSVSAVIKTSEGTTVVVAQKPLPAVKENNALKSTYWFRFLSLAEKKLQFDLVEKTQQAEVKVQSPVYELWPAEDTPPNVEILSKDKTLASLRLPELGRLSWQFRAYDDFDIRSTRVFITENNQILKAHEITKGALQKKRIGNKTVYHGEVNIDLSDIKFTSNSIAIYMGVRDNSLIPGRFAWQKKAAPGQVAQSQAILVELPENAVNKEKWQEENEEKLADELEVYQQEYSRSESELKEILKKAQSGSDSSETKSELKKWIERRKRLKENLADFNKRLEKNVKTADAGQNEQKKRVLENISRTLEEKINKREKELSSLMKNFPKDYVRASQRIQQLTKDEYLKNLENSISQLKRLLAIKKINKLKQKLDSEISRLRKLQDDIVSRKPSADDQAAMKKHRDNIRQLEKEAEKVQNGLQGKLKQNLSFDQPQRERYNQAENQAQQAMSEGEQGRAISSMGEMQQPLEEWKKKLNKAMNSMGAGEMKKAVKAFREAAFRINEISQVWQKRFDEAQVDPRVADKKKLRKLGVDISTLRDSYRAVVNKMVARVGKSGLLDARLLGSLNESYSFFQNVQSGIENNLPMSTISNSDRLIWKFNRTSLHLLKEMAKMRTQMAQVSGQQMGQQMQKSGKMQGKMQGKLNQMGSGEKEGKLSNAEKAYLKEMARREEAARKALGEMANSKELEGTSAQKEARQLLKEMKELEDELKGTVERRTLSKTEQKMKKLNEKFLRSKRSIKRKKEFDKERKAEKPNEYRIQAPARLELPEQKSKPPIDFDLDLSEAQKLFFREYLQNLENTQQ